VALAAVSAGEQYDVRLSLTAHVTELCCALLIAYWHRHSLNESAPNVKHNERIRAGQEGDRDNAHEIHQKRLLHVFLFFWALINEDLLRLQLKAQEDGVF
jgi:hypothetical protein